MASVAKRVKNRLSSLKLPASDETSGKACFLSKLIADMEGAQPGIQCTLSASNYDGKVLRSLGPDLVPVLHDQIKAGNATSALIDSVAALGPAAKPIVPELLKRLKELNATGGDGWIDQRILKALVAIGDDSEEVKATLNETYNKAKDSNTKIAALHALEKITQHQESPSRIESLLTARKYSMDEEPPSYGAMIGLLDDLDATLSPRATSDLVDMASSSRYSTSSYHQADNVKGAIQALARLAPSATGVPEVLKSVLKPNGNTELMNTAMDLADVAWPNQPLANQLEIEALMSDVLNNKSAGEAIQLRAANLLLNAKQERQLLGAIASDSSGSKAALEAFVAQNKVASIPREILIEKFSPPVAIAISTLGAESGFAKEPLLRELKGLNAQFGKGISAEEKYEVERKASGYSRLASSMGPGAGAELAPQLMALLKHLEADERFEEYPHYPEREVVSALVGTGVKNAEVQAVVLKRSSDLIARYGVLDEPTKSVLTERMRSGEVSERYEAAKALRTLRGK
jgi:hypothetical protein